MRVPLLARWQVDEEYVQVTRQLRETATELLRVQLKQAHPGRADAAIAALLAERMGSGAAGGGEDGRGPLRHAA